MNWMKPLLPLAAVLCAPACTHPCDKDQIPDDPLTRISGSGRLLLTCNPTKEQRVLSLEDTWTLSSGNGKDPDEPWLGPAVGFHAPDTQYIYLTFHFPRSLGDGTYAFTEAASTPVAVSGTELLDHSGVMSFARTRDVPFVDQEKPRTGDYFNTIDMTFELKGHISPLYLFPCAEPLEFEVEPTTVHLEKTTTIETCNAGDALSNVHIGGGH